MLVELAKRNPYKDAKGRFASAPGGGTAPTPSRTAVAEAMASNALHGARQATRLPLRGSAAAAANKLRAAGIRATDIKDITRGARRTPPGMLAETVARWKQMRRWSPEQAKAVDDYVGELTAASQAKWQRARRRLTGKP